MAGVDDFVTAAPSADPDAAIGVLVADAREASSLRYTFAARSVVEREVRGTKMHTVAEVFDEFAAALQFPYYFGENKDAFDECMRDLEEFVGDARCYLVVVRDAEELLRDAPDELDWFVDAMRFYAEQWANLDEPVGFRVILQTADRADLKQAPQTAVDLTF